MSILGEVNATSRGFQQIKFKDLYSKACSIQQSSAIDGTPNGLDTPGSSFLWIGLEKSRMHLSREHVRELIGVLIGWLTDGKLGR